ncbi:hypothetical protein E2C01_039625 [Portunus trituberculatus]|uniref:Integrase catalytic domain-containing protein n=1 Tax=Portunus trituberculatus TaxID=210409 RepID=A0A5B7FL87_PORTR|nr:hypothetical protein [Portunus trituberculatus]
MYDTNTPAAPVEPLMLTPPPIYPFQLAVVDLFQLSGEVYAADVDRLTSWLEVEHFPTSSTSTLLIPIIRRWFRRFGIPEVLSYDGGTNFVSEEVRAFLSTWHVELCLSSAHFPQSRSGSKIWKDS